MIDLGTLGGSMSVAYGINNNGQIIGEAYRSGSGGDHAFRCTVDDAGIPHMIDLGTLTGGAFSAGYGINDNGLVVGLAYVNGTVSHAFLHDGTSMYDLNSLMDGSGSGWVLQEARDINNLGQIVGYGRHDGSTHAFLLTPVPEPATWILLAVAMSFLVLVCRRKRQ
jgi:probable HAF family extracellular repeat protein